MVLLVVVIGVSGYLNYKKNAVKNDVKEYLINEKHVKEKDILALEPSIENLSGDKKYIVYVKIRGDKRKYYYYKDTKKNKVLLESYILNGKEHVVN
nr:hypothetical protein [Scopulibacillus daqui]